MEKYLWFIVECGKVIYKRIYVVWDYLGESIYTYI